MRTLIVFCLALFVAPALPAQSSDEAAGGAVAGLTAEQIMDLASVHDVFPSGDGKTVVYVTIAGPGPSEARGGSRLRVMLLPEEGGAPRPLLASEGNVAEVAWTPGDEAVLFVDRRGGDAHREVWSLPMKGPGEATRVTKTSSGVGDFALSPDGRFIAFTSLDEKPKAQVEAEANGYRAEVVGESDRPISAWLWDVEAGSASRITTGVSVHAMEWAPNSSKLALQISPRNDVDDSYMAKRLHVYHLDTKALVALEHVQGKLEGMAWSPDGKRLAFLGAADRRDPHAGMLWVVAEGEPARLVTPGLEATIDSLTWAPHPAPVVVVSRGVVTSVVQVSADDGSVLGGLTPDGLAIESIATAGAPIADGAFGDLWVVASSPAHPAEIFRLGADRRLYRRTDSNPWLKGVALGRQEARRIKARDGLEIEGLLIHPPEVAEGARTPLVICVHGGPEAHFSNGWITRYSEPGQALAARGYRVWYPNYRSSTGYGVAFAKSDHGDLMGGEFDDHLDAIAAFAEEGLIDPERVGIIGGSYGGYTAAWAATAGTEHFAAAIAFVPFVDIRTKWLTSDIPNEFYFVHYEEKWPHEQVAYLAERSPLTHAPACKTPLLLLGGDSDPRVHPSQPFMLYRAVKTATQTPVRYVRYPGEGHGNRIAAHRYDLCLRALRWFDHYLGEGATRDRALPPAELDYGRWTR